MDASTSKRTTSVEKKHWASNDSRICNSEKRSYSVRSSDDGRGERKSKIRESPECVSQSYPQTAVMRDQFFSIKSLCASISLK